jgi:hypothetical protein
MRRILAKKSSERYPKCRDNYFDTQIPFLYIQATYSMFLSIINSIGFSVNSSSAKKHKHSRFAPVCLLFPEAISKIQLECTWGGFYPPFVKGGAGGFLAQARRRNPPFPPFSKGGFSAILR